MTAQGNTGSHRAQRRPFIPVLWLILAVVMLSALMPLGPPASRTTGSAFSPATTAVAIKARAAVPVVMYMRIVPPPADPPAAVATVPSLALIVLLIALVPLRGSGPARVPGSALVRSRRARAPPALMD
ncbi:hypothetical protein WG908_01590 [Sphingobium sp. AN641]|uniref:hypothetical protein n=1 Tax=Sphingobium sp. AN641 TaxID=3133443 RepID=UPI0030BA2FBC